MAGDSKFSDREKQSLPREPGIRSAAPLPGADSGRRATEPDNVTMLRLKAHGVTEVVSGAVYEALGTHPLDKRTQEQKIDEVASELPSFLENAARAWMEIYAITKDSDFMNKAEELLEWKVSFESLASDLSNARTEQVSADVDTRRARQSLLEACRKIDEKFSEGRFSLF